MGTQPRRGTRFAPEVFMLLNKMPGSHLKGHNLVASCDHCQPGRGPGGQGRRSIVSPF